MLSTANTWFLFTCKSLDCYLEASEQCTPTEKFSQVAQQQIEDHAGKSPRLRSPGTAKQPSAESNSTMLLVAPLGLHPNPQVAFRQQHHQLMGNVGFPSSNWQFGDTDTSAGHRHHPRGRLSSLPAINRAQRAADATARPRSDGKPCGLPATKCAEAALSLRARCSGLRSFPSAERASTPPHQHPTRRAPGRVSEWALQLASSGTHHQAQQNTKRAKH